MLTAIVVTRNRVVLLRRALQSLRTQNVGKINILVIVDDCDSTADFLALGGKDKFHPHVLKWVYKARTPKDRTGPIRLAALRNFALSAVKTEFCCFLDDDNQLEPEHYSRLLECMPGHHAAHSWRSLWTRAGAPFPIVDKHPWCRDPELASNLFMQYRNAGIYEANSNVVRDQVVLGCRAQSMVDTSEWMFRSEFLQKIGFEAKYTAEDWETSRCEDSKLLDKIVELGIKVPSTKSATLRYHMGGYSNEWSTEGAELNSWISEP